MYAKINCNQSSIHNFKYVETITYTFACIITLYITIFRVFNVVIPRPTEEPGSEWIGSNIEEGQKIVFQIAALDLFGALPYIRGKIDEG